MFVFIQTFFFAINPKINYLMDYQNDNSNDNRPRGRIMKKFISLVLFALCSTCVAGAKSAIGVISADESTFSGYYYIYKDASKLVAEKIVSEFKKNEYKEELTLLPLPDYTPQVNALKNEYKNTYLINQANLKKINQNTKCDYILLISSSLDIQSNLMDTTWWNRLNVAGSDVIDPKYNLTTIVTLIDTKNGRRVWDNVYEEKLSAEKFNILNAENSPNLTQLRAIHKFANKIAPEIALTSQLYIKDETTVPEKEIQLNNLKKAPLFVDEKSLKQKIEKEEVKLNNVMAEPEFVDEKSFKQKPKKEDNTDKSARKLTHIKEVEKVIIKEESLPKMQNRKIKIKMNSKNTDLNGKLFQRTPFLTIQGELEAKEIHPKGDL